MRPRLVFDGDCGFCRYTVDYARAITGEAVEYRPYQEVADEHPDVNEAEFAASIQLFSDEGAFAGAEAAFRVLALGGRRFWFRLYRLTGLGPLFEWLYAFVSRRREICYRIAKPLFGARLGPRTHLRTADLLYRGIAFCGLCAFVSFWVQAHGLIGSGGILPLEQFLDAVAGNYGNGAFFVLPTAFWLNASDTMLHVVCALGVAATLLGLLGRLRFSAAMVAYVCYLSLFHAGQVFTGYQWDILLTECFLLAAILSRAPTLGIWVARLLLFRFMLLSGAVKLLSGDPTWADGSALSFHFETQPLPTVLGWYAHQLPDALLRWGVYGTFFIELVLAFFVFLPRYPRLLAGLGFVLLEVLILLTGNYNFFNLLTIVLCISLLDDSDRAQLPRKLRVRGMTQPTGRRWLSVGFAVLIMVQGLVVTFSSLTRSPTPFWVRLTSPFLLANPYGLFAVMTTHRDELVVEGSLDGNTWRVYGFKYKPGPVERAPRLATPHQPRLDWQMWFAALGQPGRAPWIYDFASALLEARPAVLSLVEDPFAGKPPQFVRVRRYRYHFTTPASRSESGAWWTRGEAGDWLGPIRLRKPVVTHEPLTLEPLR